MSTPIIQHLVDEIVLIEEHEIVDAMQFVFERMKIVIEPSSAVAIAPLLQRKVAVSGKKVGVIISGGNVDLRKWFNSVRKKTIEQ